MSKRSRRNFNRSHVVDHKRNLAREAEILSSPTARFENDPVIKALMNRLAAPDCTNVEAANIGFALQQLVRGDASLLSNASNPDVAEVINKTLESRAAQDRAAEAYEADKMRFVENVINEADKIAPTGDEKFQAIANGAQQYQKAIQMSNAKKASKRMKLAWHLENDPKILVRVSPIFERTTVAGVIGEVERPVVVRIMDRKFVLQPGEQMLPKIIADQYYRIMRGREENQERRNVMRDGRINAFELTTKQRQLDAKYGSKGESVNVPQEVL